MSQRDIPSVSCCREMQFTSLSKTNFQFADLRSHCPPAHLTPVTMVFSKVANMEEPAYDIKQEPPAPVHPAPKTSSSTNKLSPPAPPHPPLKSSTNTNSATPPTKAFSGSKSASPPLRPRHRTPTTAPSSPCTCSPAPCSTK